MRRTLYLAVVAITGMLLTACAGGNSVPAEDPEAVGNVDETVKEAVSVQLPEISAPTEGKSYEINETCKVLETYEQYNIQVPDVQMSEELWKDGFQGLTFKSHTVAVADDTTSEGGKYDVVDTIVVAVEGANPFEILPQTIEKAVTYKRDAATLEWIKISESCKKWKIDHKKFGGTAWKMSTADGDTYIRLRDTIEFFYTNVDQTIKSTEIVKFETTILGAMATVKDGEMIMERIHILSGTVSDEGTITLTVSVYDMEKEDYKEETIEVVLSDFERIEKADLPFTEEEYKEVAAW